MQFRATGYGIRANLHGGRMIRRRSSGGVRVYWRLFALCFASLIGLLSIHVHGQVTSQRLAEAAKEPHNWLTYSGNYFSTRYSPLDQITVGNVRNLKLQWVYQSPV